MYLKDMRRIAIQMWKMNSLRKCHPPKKSLWRQMLEQTHPAFRKLKFQQNGIWKRYIINLQLFFSLVGIFLGGYLCVQFRSKQRVKIVYMTLSPMFHGPTAQEIMLYHQNDTESWQEKLPQNWWFGYKVGPYQAYQGLFLLAINSVVAPGTPIL